MMRLEALIREGNRASLADAVELYKESCGSGRLMREHDLSPKQRRRYVATTDSDHDEPIFPNLAESPRISPSESSPRILITSPRF